jgi:hypothetical protein
MTKPPASMGLDASEIRRLLPHLSKADRLELEALLADPSSFSKDPIANGEFSRPQRMFRETLADIAIYGGAAGAGNSYPRRPTMTMLARCPVRSGCTSTAPATSWSTCG